MKNIKDIAVPTVDIDLLRVQRDALLELIDIAPLLNDGCVGEVLEIMDSVTNRNGIDSIQGLIEMLDTMLDREMTREPPTKPIAIRLNRELIGRAQDLKGTCTKLPEFLILDKINTTNIYRRALQLGLDELEERVRKQKKERKSK